jgi:hypothetical protein
VEEDGEFAVGRECTSGGEIIDGARMAGNFAEELAVGELGDVRSGLGRHGERNEECCEQENDFGARETSLHGTRVTFRDD